MTAEPIFFEIPIYRTNIQVYLEEMQDIRDKNYSSYPGEKSGRHFESFKALIHRKFWYPWKYNEVIGYLNLYVFGSQFRVDYWFVSSKRINKGILKKKFVFQGKVLEASINNKKDSEEIFEWILKELSILQKEKKFKKRYFDLRTFKVVGKYVDWKKLCDELNSWKYPEFRDKYFSNEN